MKILDKMGIGTRIGLLAGTGMLVLVVALLIGYAYKQQQSAVKGEVKAARQLVLMAESVRQQTAEKWDMGVYSPKKLRHWAAEADSTEERRERILDAVPVVNAWRAAQAKADQGGFDFKPLRRNPRDEDHAPNPVEREALEYFEANPN
ncbi:MAG TPA: DUF3365 domain-containing protein, partial [Gammaproteobacteria bacterium]|nr:DUF3365 domain-containing protein [Gammaproteobacteria bacterium]